MQPNRWSGLDEKPCKEGLVLRRVVAIAYGWWSGNFGLGHGPAPPAARRDRWLECGGMTADIKSSNPKVC